VQVLPPETEKCHNMQWLTNPTFYVTKLRYYGTRIAYHDCIYE